MRMPFLLGPLLAALAVAPLPATDSPVVLALVLDTSGSLGKKDEEARQRLARDAAQGLPAGSEVAVFAFDDQPRLVVPRTTKQQEVVDGVSALHHAGQYTALYDAVFDASRYLGQAPGTRKAILLITDGLDENSALTLEDGMKTAQELKIPVFTIGVGHVQERVLRRMAKLTGGEYFEGKATQGKAVAARIAALTPTMAPKPETTLSAVAVPEPAPAAALRAATATPAPIKIEKPGTSTALLAMIGVLVLGLIAVAFFVLSRKPAERAEPVSAKRTVSAAAAGDEEETLIARVADFEEPHEPTLILTLKPLLHVTRGPATGRFFEVSNDTATSVGRARGNDVVIEDQAISSQHCRIRPAEGGSFEIFDLKSTNGTYVNERKVARQLLTAGDVIKIGGTVMQFRMDHMMK